MSETAKLSERLAVISVVNPASYGTGDQTSTVVDMRYWLRALFVVATGVLPTGATLAARLQGAQDSAFTQGVADITGKQITTLVDTNDNVQTIIEVSQDEVRAQGLRYVRARCTLGGASAPYAVVALGEPAHYSGDVTAQDLASVLQIVP